MSNRTEIFEMSARTFAGLENILADELKSIGAQNVREIHRAVNFDGDKSLLYKANLNLRSSVRVFKTIIKFEVDNPRSLQKGVMDADWSEYITLLNTFDVDAVIKSRYFQNPKFVAQKVKDSIADQFRKKTGKRPYVDVNNPSVKIQTHIHDNQCIISLDSSGEALNHRGYRQDFHDSIINEVLYAGLVLLTGWDKQGYFIDPLCGNGSLLVESAMIAHNISPCLFRKDFAFKHWKDFDDSLWNKILEEEKKSKIDSRAVIFGSDIIPAQIVAARGNIKRAGLENKIEIGLKSFDKFQPAVNSGVIILNTCQREISANKDLKSFLNGLVDKFKTTYSSFDKWLISTNPEILNQLNLSSEIEMIFSAGQNKIHFNRI